MRCPSSMKSSVKDPEPARRHRSVHVTRVPFQALLDYLEGGQTLDEFLDDFPTVTQAAAISCVGTREVSGRRPLGMRVLNDECLPRKLKKHLTRVTIAEPFQRQGQQASVMGSFSLTERQKYEIFLTMDKGVAYEHNLRGLGLAIIILRATSNPLADLLPYVPDCLKRMKSIKPGEVVRVGLR